MKILGIETSCDETAVAILEGKGTLHANIVSSQVDLHRKYGGVYPELAARAHIENIIPCLKAALDKSQASLNEIDLIATTTGPGLIGSLLVGVNTAKTLAYSLNKPIIGVNHLEGHIYSNFIGKIPKFPVLCLIVSGGHTSLVLIKNHGKYQIIGQTRDDAAGEAFDKVAKLLGLGYPGGPAIEAAASKFKTRTIEKFKLKIELPRPMIASPDFDFSFSGLKTAVLRIVKQMSCGRLKNVRQDLAASFQQAVIDVLVEKTLKAAKKYNTKSILLCGGVACNKLLRNTLKEKIKKELPAITYHLSPITLSTDNAAMVATASYFKALENKYDKWYNINAQANAKLENW